MIIIDENFPDSQRQLLKSWRISVRQIGPDIGRFGMKDDEIIPLLMSQARPSFFSLDADFYSRALLSKRYCLISLAVQDNEAAHYARTVMKHFRFDTTAKRLGTVLRVSQSGIRCWTVGEDLEQVFQWEASRNA